MLWETTQNGDIFCVSWKVKLCRQPAPGLWVPTPTQLPQWHLWPWHYMSLPARPGTREAQRPLTLSHLESPSGRLQCSKLKSSLSNWSNKNTHLYLPAPESQTCLQLTHTTNGWQTINKSLPAPGDNCASHFNSLKNKGPNKINPILSAALLGWENIICPEDWG